MGMDKPIEDLPNHPCWIITYEQLITPWIVIVCSCVGISLNIFTLYVVKKVNIYSFLVLKSEILLLKRNESFMKLLFLS